MHCFDKIREWILTGIIFACVRGTSGLQLHFAFHNIHKVQPEITALCVSGKTTSFALPLAHERAQHQQIQAKQAKTQYVLLFNLN